MCQLAVGSLASGQSRLPRARARAPAGAAAPRDRELVDVHACVVCAVSGEVSGVSRDSRPPVRLALLVFIEFYGTALPYLYTALANSASAPARPATIARRSRGQRLLYFLLCLVELLDPMQDGLLGGLLDLAREEELVEDHVDLVEVEDEVELAHVAKELIAGGGGEPRR